MKKLFNVILLLVSTVWSFAVMGYTFYIPYMYFADQNWLIENLGLVASMPLQWYLLWALCEYCKKWMVNTFGVMIYSVARMFMSPGRRELMVSEDKWLEVFNKSALDYLHKHYKF